MYQLTTNIVKLYAYNNIGGYSFLWMKKYDGNLITHDNDSKYHFRVNFTFGYLKKWKIKFVNENTSNNNIYIELNGSISTKSKNYMEIVIRGNLINPYHKSLTIEQWIL